MRALWKPTANERADDVHRILQIRTGKHPHEVLVLIFTTILGTVGSVMPSEISDSVAGEFPWPWCMIYWIAMTATGLLTLSGIFNRKIEGLLIERAGLTLQATLFGAYIYAVSQHAGMSGLVSMVLPASLIAGNIYRCWQIKTDLALLTSYLKDHPGERVR